MNRGDIILATFIAAAVLGATALFLATVSVAAEATVFDVTDPDRGMARDAIRKLRAEEVDSDGPDCGA
jgi:hypothetical protein